MDETISGETMALYVLHKFNNKLKFLHHENILFLTPRLRHFLCNALILIMIMNFDYECFAWYPNLTKKFKCTLKTNVCSFVCS